MKLVLFFVFFIAFSVRAALHQAFPKTANPSLYSIADLEALERDQNYREFFAHALDIRPSKRNDHWLQLVQSMAERLASDGLKKSSFQEDLTKKVIALSLWPVLKDDEFFRYRADRFILHSLKSCPKTIEAFPHTCVSIFNRFLQTGPSKSIYSDLIAIAYSWQQDQRYLEKNEENKLRFSAEKLMLEFISHELSEFYCAKSPYHQIITQWITTSQPTKKDIETQFHADCWKVYTGHILSTFNTASSFNFSLFSLLNETKSLNQPQRDFLLVHGLLNESFSDPLYRSMSWNQLHILAQKHSRREKVIKQLSESTFLPDNAFKTADNHLFYHLQKNLPEYINLYAKRCLDYLEGKASFIKGNPTLNCQSFFLKLENNNEARSLYRSYLERYQKAINL